MNDFIYSLATLVAYLGIGNRLLFFKSYILLPVVKVLVGMVVIIL